MKSFYLFCSLLVSVSFCALPPFPGRGSNPIPMHTPSGAKQAGRAAYKNRLPCNPPHCTCCRSHLFGPRGWLERQLRIQADGLSGHLDEVWSDVGPNSAWLGGTGEAWERGPYFLDGLVPLAYLLDDAKLKAKAEKWVNWTLTHQRADGSIGPVANQDWWPRMVMLKVLTQYQEATGDPRVIPLMQQLFCLSGPRTAEAASARLGQVSLAG